MLVVLILLVVVVLGLGLALARSTARVTDLESDLAGLRSALTEATAAVAAAESATSAMAKERDDALDRVARARRDAAEVAKRMQEEAEARVAAEAQHASAEQERERLAAELVSVADAQAAGGEENAAELWALALEGVRRTWDVSVSPSPGTPSPLEDADDQLRAAIEIEVDAAREEAGAAITLEWVGSAPVAVPVAVRALSIAQAVIARLAKSAEEATLRVESTEVSVTIGVDAVDADGKPILPADIAPEHQVEPGRYVLRMGSAVEA